MAVLLSELPDSGVFDPLPHKTWVRDELEILESTGLLQNHHYELIDGELIDKMGKKRKHVNTTTHTARAFRARLGEDFVNTETPIDVAPRDNASNEPEPDVVILRRPYDTFEGNPRPEDLALVIEVADSSLRLDLGTKAALYAAAGIVEYWVVDINNRLLHVLLEPDCVARAYGVKLEYRETDIVKPAALAGLEIPVMDLLLQDPASVATR